jgi:hypothetical protein
MSTPMAYSDNSSPRGRLCSRSEYQLKTGQLVGWASMLQYRIELDFEAIHVIEFIEMIADMIACGDSTELLGGVFVLSRLL